MEERQMPSWIDLIDRQIQTDKWFRPVDQVWREFGWKPPSTECPETMRKHKAFRSWSHHSPSRESQS